MLTSLHRSPIVTVLIVVSRVEVISQNPLRQRSARKARIAHIIFAIRPRRLTQIYLAFHGGRDHAKLTIMKAEDRTDECGHVSIISYQCYSKLDMSPTNLI